MIMTFDLTLNEVVRKMPADDFKQWQQWLEERFKNFENDFMRF